MSHVGRDAIADASLVHENQKLKRILHEALIFLDSIAYRCDDWARESKKYGWSTHQVEKNRATADKIRRFTAKHRSR